MAYSPEMRRDVLEMDEHGATTHEIAIELNVSKSWVRRVKQQFRETGKTAAKTTKDRAVVGSLTSNGWPRKSIRGPTSCFVS